jgi:hypothetical protein
VIEPLLLKVERRTATRDASGIRTGWCPGASCSSCTPAPPGNTCRRTRLRAGHGLLTGSKRNDVTPLIQAVPPVRGKRGRPGAARTRRDRCYHRVCTQQCAVERLFTHLCLLCRLRIRRGIRDDIHEAFRALGYAVILPKTPAGIAIGVLGQCRSVRVSGC